MLILSDKISNKGEALILALKLVTENSFSNNNNNTIDILGWWLSVL
jgi:hypothetical protein